MDNIETGKFIGKKDSLLFTCPKCGNGALLMLKNTTKGSSSKSNGLECTKCERRYPIIDGIPRLVDLDNYSESFGYQWNIHVRTQLDSYTGLSISRDRLYAATGWRDAPLTDDVVLEAGSGAGRFTEVLVKTGADIYSFDYSRAVDANKINNGTNETLTLFQGDIFNIPFDDNTFDHVLCLGVIQHTPDPKVAFYSLASKVKPGGKLYIDVYTRSWYHLLHWRYLLRPLTKRIDRQLLYKIVKTVTPKLVPLSKLFGRFGSRLVPIVQFSHLGLKDDINNEWAILDTFDMYSPAHDHPQSLSTIQSWFDDLGFTDTKVWYGDNGVVGRGTKPYIKSPS